MRGKGFRIIVATILSTVLHFFILTLLDTIPLISKELPPQPTLYMVDLVPLAREQPAPQREEEPAIRQKVEEVKKEEVKKEEIKKEDVKREEVKKKEEVKKEEVKKEEVKEVQKKEEVKKEDKKVAADAGTEQEKKKVEKQPLDPDKQLSAKIKEIEQNVASRETDGAFTRSQDYDYNKLENQVKSFWAIPDTLSEKGLKAVIIIEIDKNGELVKTEFEQSSGNVVFDQAVIRAIRKAAPFDPPVGSVPLEIGLRFP